MDPEIQEQYEEQLRQSTELLSQYNSTMTAILSAMEGQAAATRKLSGPIVETTQAFEGLTAKQRAYQRAEEKRIEQTELANKTIAKFNERVDQAAGVVMKFGKTVMDGSESLNKYNGIIGSLGDSALSLGRNFGILGSVIGGIVKVSTSLLEYQLTQKTNLLSFNDQISKLGAANAFSTASIMEMARKTGLASNQLDLIMKPIQSLGSSFKSIGQGADDSTKKFFEMTAVTEKTRNEFRILGFNDKERIEGQADYIEQMASMGVSLRGIEKTSGGLQKASLDYMKNLQVISEITGRTAEAQQKEQQLAAANIEFQLYTNQMNQKIAAAKTPEEQEKLRAELAQANLAVERIRTLKGEEQALGFAQRLAGGVQSVGLEGQALTGSRGIEDEMLRMVKSGTFVGVAAAQQEEALRNNQNRFYNQNKEMILYGGQELQGNVGGLSALANNNILIGQNPEQIAADLKKRQEDAAKGEGASATDPAQAGRILLVESERKLRLAFDSFAGSIGLAVPVMIALMGAAGLAALTLRAIGKLDLGGMLDQNGRGRRNRNRTRGRNAAGGAGRLLGSGAGRLLAGSAVVGAGLDIYGRAQEKQSATQIATGVGGGLAGAALGAKGGAMAGGAIGALLGPLGLAAGAGIGGLLGGGLGYFAGGKAGDALFGAFKGKGKPESEVATPGDTAIFPETQAILNEPTSDSTTIDSTTEMSESIKKFKDELLSTGNMLNRFKQALDALSQLMFNMSGNTETTSQGGSTSGAPQAAGGAIGALLGPLGLAAGAGIGGLLGGGLGYFAGGKAGDALFGAFKGKGKPEPEAGNVQTTGIAEQVLAGKDKPESEVAIPGDTAISPETQAILNESAKSSKALEKLIKPTSDSTTIDSTTEMSESIKKFKDELLSTGNMLNRFKQALDALSQLMFNMSGNTETTSQGGSYGGSYGGSTSGAPQVPANLGSYMAATAMIESGGRADARATTSSAGGMFQFLDSTWKQLTKEMGKDYSLQDKFDPNKAAEVMAYFTEKQRKQLEKGTGRRASNTDLYMAHFLGAGGATQFLNAMNRDPNAIAADLNPSAAKANRNIYYDGDRARTLGEVYELMNKKMSTATAKVQKGATPEFVQQLARSGGPQLAGGPPADTKLISSKPDNVKLGPNAELSGMNSNLLSRFFTAAKEFRRNITVNSAHRDDQKQAELWLRHELGEPGVHKAAKPSKTTQITYKGKQHTVPGSGTGSKHGRGEALDISTDRGAFDPYLHKYGLHRPHLPWDPPHVELKAEKGGVFTGPSSGYPATLHGTELIAPLVNNSALMMLAKSPATQLDSLMDMKDDKAFGSLSSASFTPKTMTATINKIVRDMNSEKTATVENTIKNDTFARNANLDNTRINIAVMELLNAKLDSMVDAIRTNNDISEKILRASNN